MPARETFAYEGQQAPLNVKGCSALADLRKDHSSLNILNNKLKRAREMLLESAGELNEKSFQIRSDAKQRSQSNDADLEDDQTMHHADFERKVTELTKKMDMGIRGVIEHQTWAEGIPTTMDNVAKKARESAETTRTRAEAQAAESDETMENNQEEADQVNVQPDQTQTPSALLQQSLEKHATDRSAQTLTQRYAHHNDYVEFYGYVHAAKHDPDNVPAMVHADFWFAEEEGRETQRLAQEALERDDDADSDLEVRSERISIRCPITYMDFVDPWTARTCKHSFEKEAILSLVKQAGRAGAKCPVCDVPLVEADLQPNVVLQRKVKRIVEKRRKEQEAMREDGSSDDDGLPRGTQQRPARLGSGSPPARRISRKVKEENVRSTLAAGNRRGGRAAAARIDDIEDEEDSQMT